MNREEALEEFKTKIAPNYIDKCTIKFEANLSKYEDEISKILINSIVKVNEKVKDVKKTNANYAINILQYELLRTNVLDESFVIWLHAYNINWYMDEESVYEEIDFKFLFEPFIELRKSLISEKNIYIGKVNNYDIQKIVFNELRKCYYNMESYVREIFYDLDENKKISNVLFDEYYLIKWSEFRDESRTVFSMDYRVKDIEELKRFCKEPYIYPVFRKSRLEDFNINNTTLLYANFKESELTHVNMIQCISPRCEYSYVKFASNVIKNCVMTGSNFKDTKMNTMIFEDCNLVGCNFNNSDSMSVVFKNCNIENSSFYNSSFYNVEFIKCNLRSVNFINSNFEKVNFEESNLKEAAFNEEVIPFLHISAEQLQDINVWGEIK
ncbi:pentapeptide repeat-containing protein [Clostridium sp. HMSC19A10]|uniref:pentapeptide repeat-containing protein n=1 Tax=Clostridium sp. HMSC19A10 TaxID=1581148 RepID=UPI0008A46C09|nr:pentapeptide repeat-containing protein [Clostridium sp. HMSC19A10]OFS25008.1 hypothetical protein HMPREF3070_02950 [Clostridium sp. HMSC19A10]